MSDGNYYDDIKYMNKKDKEYPKKKKKDLSPAEEDENRSQFNPFQDRDEEDGVDLSDPTSIKNSFLEEDEDENDGIIDADTEDPDEW